MVAPLSEFARTYYPGKDIASDGDPIVENIADAGGSITTLVDAAITEADGYYEGAIIYFSGDTTTVALQGHFAHVKTWTFSSNTFTFAKDLPAIPVAGDTFNIIFGGNKRSSQETFGLLAGGVQPELTGVVGANITGLTITKLSGKLGEETLTVDWDDTADEIAIKIGAEVLGAPYTVTGDDTDVYVYANDGQSFMRFDVVEASLPVGDEVDTHTLTRPDQTLTPDYEGYETLSANNGKTRYRLEVIKNDDPSNAMTALEVFTGKPAGAATVLSSGQSISLAESTFDVDDATGWPTKAFWVELDDGVNTDFRYIKSRSGNTLTALLVDWMLVPFDQGQQEPTINSIAFDTTTGSTGIVDQVIVTSGTFGGSDAAGFLLLKLVDGPFNNNDEIELDSDPLGAIVDGSGVFGLRGATAISFTAGDAIEPMGDIDIGLETPAGGDTYDDPADEITNPAGVTFSKADAIGLALTIGALAIAAQHGVWRREWIMNEAEARADINADTNYNWS